MGFADKLKDLGDKAKDAAAERKDQINQAVQTAGEVADQRTGGKYRNQISKATQKAEAAVERMTAPDGDSGQGAQQSPPVAQPQTETQPPVSPVASEPPAFDEPPARQG